MADQDKYAEAQGEGAYKRPATAFHEWIGEDCELTPDAGRYHLYYSHACPWAHRTMVVRALKGLNGVISASPVHWLLEHYPLAKQQREDPALAAQVSAGKVEGYRGWSFIPAGSARDEYGGRFADPLHPEFTHTLDLYLCNDTAYPATRLSVPILFDKKTGRIVNNESADIIRIFNSWPAGEGKGEIDASAPFAGADLAPPELATAMEEWDALIYPKLNDGVYRCGFAATQDAYDAAVIPLFAALDAAEAALAENFSRGRKYLCGDTLTLSDIRLWTTLFRFDRIYNTHFKCNRRRIADYPHLWDYARYIYQLPGVAATCDLEIACKHYYQSHTNINGYGIVALGPEQDWDEPTRREQLAGADQPRSSL